ncbi:MAG: hypothetical protein H0T84_01580 [Tatlockia sp.]|nr:hypothetical protein [Tatlockia sp.]
MENSTSQMLMKMKSDLSATTNENQAIHAAITNPAVAPAPAASTLPESEHILKNLMEFCLSPKGKPKHTPTS